MYKFEKNYEYSVFQAAWVDHMSLVLFSRKIFMPL